MYRGRLADTLNVQLCFCVYDSIVILHRVGRRLGWSIAYMGASMSSVVLVAAGYGASLRRGLG